MIRQKATIGKIRFMAHLWKSALISLKAGYFVFVKR